MGKGIRPCYMVRKRIKSKVIKVKNKNSVIYHKNTNKISVYSNVCTRYKEEFMSNAFWGLVLMTPASIIFLLGSYYFFMTTILPMLGSKSKGDIEGE